MAPDSAVLEDLDGRLAGRLLRPGDDGYDAAAASTTASSTARRRRSSAAERLRTSLPPCARRVPGLDICVRGGGHNVAGRAVVDGAVMIDLAEMKGIEVDPRRRTVRAEGGLTGPSSTAPSPSTASPSPGAPSPPPGSPGSRSAAASAG